jgi:hypothetical protein
MTEDGTQQYRGACQMFMIPARQHATSDLQKRPRIVTDLEWPDVADQAASAGAPGPHRVGGK